MKNFTYQNEVGKCCRQGCNDDAEYQAPKSPANLKERHWFCLKHVREYNKSWNFFANMSQREVEEFHIDSITGHRPTRPRGMGKRNYDEGELREEFFREFGFSKEKQQVDSIPQNEKEALDVLGLRYPITFEAIKKKYKELAKRYHPDINPDAGEERLKNINQAYSVLKECGSFSN